MKRLLQKSSRMREATSGAIDELRSLSIEDLLREADELLASRGGEIEQWVNAEFEAPCSAVHFKHVMYDSSEVFRAEYSGLNLSGNEVKASSKAAFVRRFLRVRQFDWKDEQTAAPAPTVDFQNVMTAA